MLVGFVYIYSTFRGALLKRSVDCEQRADFNFGL